jgi:hypothetical protein
MNKTREQLEAEAAQLEAQAGVNDAYRAAMERTTRETGGRLGHLNAPMAYAVHGKAAADKRALAADLRRAAAALGAKGGSVTGGRKADAARSNGLRGGTNYKNGRK